MKVSVIVPTRLAVNPASGEGNLYLDRSLGSLKRQTRKPDEVIVSADPNQPPGMPPPRFMDVAFTYDGGNSQARAMNAGVAAATGDVIVFLEDDDYFEPRYIETALAALEQGYSIVTSSKREVNEQGAFLRYNDYPSPSGWLMRRSTWNSLAGLDESYRWHLDNDFLGKATKAGEKRIHLVEANAPARPWLVNVAKVSAIAQTSDREPLVVRTANSKGGMARIATDPECAAQSQAEHARLEATYGGIPW